MLLAGIYSVRMDSRLKTSGMTTITVIIYWDWCNLRIGLYGIQERATPVFPPLKLHTFKF